MSPNDPDGESVERRLAAVERALAEDEPLDRADRLDELEARIAELEAAVQALRGYVGSVRAINEDIEHRADIALRKATAVERHVAPEAIAKRDSADGEEATDGGRLAAESTDDTRLRDGIRQWL